MVMVNTWSCRYYLRSLDAASNSVAPTVISTASNYVLSGVIGTVMFDEAVGARWWAGAALITAGLTLLAKPEKDHED
ncbi:hypothetical protein EVAR_34195_1 [Eumeta japonica]|uniref:Transmembrane protein 42 n=1 Tax=Eumeta variegata TaxID=151549 RepID=A0A4C1WKL8_EUMVA|nr:hypothetical protein EVAR_34195_1 [Eumeta japonica]